LSYSLCNTTITSYWRGKPLSAREVFDRMAAFLKQLQSFNDLFSCFYISNGTTDIWTPLKADLSDAVLEVSKRTDPEVAYSNADANDKSFSMQSYSPLGFSALFATVSDSRKDGFWIDIVCGQDERHSRANAPNRVTINVSPSLANPNFLRALLQQTVVFWKPADAAVSHPDVDSLLRQPAGEISPGWLTYLAEVSAADLPLSKYTYECFEDGIIIQASEEPGKKNDPVYVSRLSEISHALKLIGLTKGRKEASTII